MTQQQILEEIKRLAPSERLHVMEAILGLVKEDLQLLEQLQTQEAARQQNVAQPAYNYSASQPEPDQPESHSSEDEGFTKLSKL